MSAKESSFSFLRVLLMVVTVFGTIYLAALFGPLGIIIGLLVLILIALAK